MLRRNKGLKTGIFVCGIFAAVFLLYALLIFAAEFVCYYTPGYFKKEYEKYDVVSSVPGMHMDGEGGLAEVTEHMMKYLKGDKDTPELQIEADIGGERRGFFSEREIAHMKDCRELFRRASEIRVLAIFCCVLMILISRFFCGGRGRAFFPVFGSGLLAGTFLSAVSGIVFGISISNDFSGIFIKFHHIFFDNDLWLLDPSKDMLVNIVPEGFFYDTAVRITAVFAVFVVLMSAAAVFLIVKGKKTQ